MTPFLTPSRLARAGLCLALALAAAGCVTTQGSLSSPLPLQRAPIRSDHEADHEARAARYALLQDVVVAGTTLRKGTYVYGIPDDKSWQKNPGQPDLHWVLPPEYERLSGYGKVMYGKRFGQPQWVRIDLSGPSPKETPSPYVMVRRIPGTDFGGPSPKDQWVAVEANGGQVVFLDPQGNPAFRTDVLKTPAEPRKSVTVLHGGEAFVVSHPEHDRIYAKDGTPKSPPLPRLWQGWLLEQPDMRNSGTSSAPVTAAVIDAQRSLYWPINADGSIMPKPDDLLGLQPIKASNTTGGRSSSGWLVWWQTPEGERCARVGTKNGLVDPRAIIESREQAHYVEWELEMASDGLNDIRRRAGQDRYEVHYWYKFLERQTFATVADAHAYMKASRDAGARAYAELQQNTRDQQKAREAAQAAQRQQALARSGQDTRSYEERATTGGFDLAMKNGDRLTARRRLLEIPYDRERWTRYVQTYGLDPAGDNSSQSVSYARAWGSGTDFTVLHAATKRAPMPLRNPNAAPPPKEMSDWEYFWHGKPTGVGRIGEAASPSATTDALRSRLRATEQQNFDAWMRGAQNWGAKRL